MSLMLFNMCGEYVLIKALAEVGDLKIAERVIKKFRFADNTTIIAEILK